ncbi:hypothetical protein [Pseudonocardia sp. ICBG1293]|uniref:hypothetical protein n=1 Tax=Pseudonocardia sp. ICBG1293 TaxID=2844382 RepID=UPI001CCD2138|nr:hypothetical protein [Pseudonocardia sp. ICBG1293]
MKFDHDFVGRDALQRIADGPHRRKVWLRWNPEDVARIHASSLFDGEKRAKYLDTPLGRYSRIQMDSVLVDDRPVGVSTLCGYTVNIGSWMSVGFLDEAVITDGAEVTIVWGEEDGGTPKRNVERHVQTTLRARVSTTPLGH